MIDLSCLIASLSRPEKEEAVALLEEKARRVAHNKILSYYPDTGPLRRELYPKHLAFFAAGKEHRERLFLSANRVGKCISGQTLIETPHGDPRAVKDIAGAHWVWAWDGTKKVPALACAPFKKAPEMVYRVWLSSGQYVDCAAEHRFLTETGWLFLSDLLPQLPEHAPGLLGSTPEAFCLSNAIVAYQPIGVQGLYDFHVPGWGNYCTAGMIHHNSEGAGGYELTLHLTGRYPGWWPGYRFDHPIAAWMAGDTRQTTRDIQQAKLVGLPGAIGTGLIPGDLITDLRPMSGVVNAYEQIMVKHVAGGVSILQSRSYDQGREAFQGTERHVIWLDEECPYPVYTESLTRTMATGGFEGGLLMLTFTPLKGMTDVVLHFLGDDMGQSLH